MCSAESERRCDVSNVLMYGIDISNHQGRAGLDLDKLLTKHPEIKVVIIKSSEGTSFDDAYDEGFIKIALAHGCIVGVYHFARPDKNGWAAEAKYFMSLTKKHKGKVFYVLDWERNGSTAWAKTLNGIFNFSAKFSRLCSKGNRIDSDILFLRSENQRPGLQCDCSLSSLGGKIQRL